MRTTSFAVAVLFVVGCGGGDGGTDLGPADTGVDTGADTGIDADVDAGVDASGSLRMCNPYASPDASVCADPEHCSITVLAGMASYGNCVLGPGAPIAEGMSCARMALAHHPDVLADSCGDQHVCDQPNASHPHLCYRLCMTSSDCAGTDLCEIIATDPSTGLVKEGICTPDSLCDPLTAGGCASGENCIALRDTHSSTAFGTLCIDAPSSPVPDGTMCPSSILCALGSACANRRLADGGVDSTMPVCQRYCDTSADAGCGDGGTCVLYPSTSGLPPTLGLCAP